MPVLWSSPPDMRPLGSRSFGPTRANMVYGPAYVKTANTSILVLAMIETREALGNLDAIS